MRWSLPLMPTLSEGISTKRPWWRDVSGTAIGAGFLAVLISYSGPLLIYLQAANAMAVPPAVFTSWVFAISMGAGLSCIFLSLWLRAPVALAWSIPGTVLLISIGTQLTLGEIVGAYLLVALALILLGLSGLFERLVQFLPPSVTDGMMAGILFGFGLNAARSLAADPVIFTVLVVAFVLLTVLLPRYAIICLVGIAIALSATVFDAPIGDVGLAFASPMLVQPVFSMAAVLGLAVPLFITTLSGQFLPGMAVLRTYGFEAKSRGVLVSAGIASAGAAFYGGVTVASAAITSAFFASEACNPDRSRRYIAGVAAGVFFCLGGIFAGTLVDLLILIPTAMISILAGLALLGAIQKSLSDMMSADNVQVGLLTFLVTTSGVTLGGIGSAFWGVVVGLAAWYLTRIATRFKPS
ncbi:MAG: benzoate/H(+) symporter BenE family transporter [Paracoccaceae bacterium]